MNLGFLSPVYRVLERTSLYSAIFRACNILLQIIARMLSSDVQIVDHLRTLLPEPPVSLWTHGTCPPVPRFIVLKVPILND